MKRRSEETLHCLLLASKSYVSKGILFVVDLVVDGAVADTPPINT